MEIEHAALDFPPTLPYCSLGAFDPDPLDVGVVEDPQDGLHVIVELLDHLGFELFDPGAEVRQFSLKLLATFGQAVALGEVVLDRGDLLV